MLSECCGRAPLWIDNTHLLYIDIDDDVELGEELELDENFDNYLRGSVSDALKVTRIFRDRASQNLKQSCVDAWRRETKRSCDSEEDFATLKETLYSSTLS